MILLFLYISSTIVDEIRPNVDFDKISMWGLAMIYYFFLKPLFASKKWVVFVKIRKTSLPISFSNKQGARYNFYRITAYSIETVKRSRHVFLLHLSFAPW